MRDPERLHTDDLSIFPQYRDHEAQDDVVQQHFKDEFYLKTAVILKQKTGYTRYCVKG